MVSGKTISLVSVACTKVPETISAMLKCQEQMKFDETKLFTHNENIYVGGIQFYKIPQLDYRGYNEFVGKYLAQYITTDYTLLVQNDGYILDGSLWDDEFLQYDYIGAPWPPNTHFTKSGKEVRVGNGGFSFRSKKLLNVLNELHLPFTDMGTGFWHEDGAICVHYREELEEYGIKFAPVEVAAKFSTELQVPETIKSFGGHKYI